MFEIKVEDTMQVLDKYVVVIGESKGQTKVGDVLLDDDQNEYVVSAIPMDRLLNLNPNKVSIGFDANKHKTDDFKGKILRTKN